MYKLILVLLALTLASCSLPRISLKQLSTKERVIVDEHGRERIFHGVNAITKGPPYIPVHDEFSTDISLTHHDF